MRLIDADKLINRISELFRNDDLYLVGKFIGLISQQPTAFDVDKVVSELEDYKMWKESLIYDLDFRERQIIKRALEIVKAGEIDD